MNFYIFTEHNSGADAITGERIYQGERVYVTEFNNFVTPYMLDNPTRIIKEETVVWLAEQAGYDVVKRDAGDFRDAEIVDSTDAGVGDGEAEVGKAETRRKQAVRRRADGPVES